MSPIFISSVNITAKVLRDCERDLRRNDEPKGIMMRNVFAFLSLFFALLLAPAFAHAQPPASPAILFPTECGSSSPPSFCSTAPANDACGWIAAAIHALPSTGGIVDGSGFVGTQTCSVNPFNSPVSNGALLLGFANFQTTAEWEIPSPFAWRIIGWGRKPDNTNFLNTTIQAVAKSFPENTPVVRLGNGSTAYGQSISNLTVDCNGVVGTTGIYSSDIQEQSGIEHVTVLNCPNRGVWMNGSGTDGTGPFFAQNYSVSDIYVLPQAAGNTSTVACEFDGAFTAFHTLQGATCGGGSSAPIADAYIFDKIFAGTATDLNAEDAATGYLLGNANAVTSLTINGMQSANISGTVVSLKSGDSSVFLTGIVNGGTAAPQTLLDSAHLSAPLKDFSIGLYAVGTGNSANGFTPVVSTSPTVPALFNSLVVNNGNNVGNTLGISSGSTTSAGAGVTLEDRGSARWSVAKDAGNNFEIFDNFDNFQFINAVPGGNGNLDLRAQGSGAVNFNDNPGSGTSGVQFFSGGATPVPVAAVTGAGQLLLHGGASISAGTGAPSAACGTSPNGSGSLFLRTDGTASTTLYSCAGTTWTAVTVP